MMVLGNSNLSDNELDQRARAQDAEAVKELMRRYNQRLLRVAWSILKDRSNAEEAVQDTFMNAFTNTSGFHAQSSYATWITRIAINEALKRKRSASRRARLSSSQEMSEIADYRSRYADAPISLGDPEQAAARAELARRIENAVAQLSEAYRLVFVLREIEQLSVEETAGVLAIPPATVKTRLLRAHRRLRAILLPDLRATLQDTFPFLNQRCGDPDFQKLHRTKKWIRGRLSRPFRPRLYYPLEARTRVVSNFLGVAADGLSLATPACIR